MRVRCLPTIGIVAFALALLASSGTQTAVANGDTRTIRLFHAHTKESIEATYRVGGQYDAAVLKQLNWFLRDWRRDEPTSMDPRLFDVVWEVYRSAGAGGEPVTVMSAYRSPETNAMLRRRSRAVAEHSQHMLGKAMDTSLPGMSMGQVREVGMRLQRGGVGYYPTAGTPFVHLDVGSVRSWPRMSYDQLVRLFPDGKTVHLPSNGQPLARYEEARAEIAAYGGVAPPSSRSTGFFAWLFGGGTRDGDDEDAAPAAPRVQTASRRGDRVQMASAFNRGAASPASSASPSGPDDSGRDFFATQALRAAVVQPQPQPAPPPAPTAPTITQAESNLPRGETYAAAAPPLPARTIVASLTPVARADVPAASVSDPSEGAFAAHPAPPRRPVDLLASLDAPLPPARPVELASFSVAKLPPGAIGYAGIETSLRRGGDPIGNLLDREPTGLTRSIERKSTMLAAPSASALALRAARAGPNLAIVPARLDRSNFRAMTAAEPAARMTTQTVSGPTLTATRSAAHARRTYLTPADGAAATAFGPRASDLSTTTFHSDSASRRAAALDR